MKKCKINFLFLLIFLLILISILFFLKNEKTNILQKKNINNVGSEPTPEIINNESLDHESVDSDQNCSSLGCQIISPNKKYKAIRNNKTKSLQIIDLANNNINFELKDKIDLNKNPDDPSSESISYYPEEWSPDGNNLVYKSFGYEQFWFDLIGFVRNNFTLSINWVNKQPDYTSCVSPIWSPDSKKLIIVGENRNPCIPPIYKIDFNKGINAKYLIEESNISNNDNSVFESIENANWSNDSRTVFLEKNTLDSNNHEIIKTEKIVVSAKL